GRSGPDLSHIADCRLVRGIIRRQPPRHVRNKNVIERAGGYALEPGVVGIANQFKKPGNTQAAESGHRENRSKTEVLHPLENRVGVLFQGVLILLDEIPSVEHDDDRASGIAAVSSDGGIQLRDTLYSI